MYSNVMCHVLHGSTLATITPIYILSRLRVTDNHISMKQPALIFWFMSKLPGFNSNSNSQRCNLIFYFYRNDKLKTISEDKKPCLTQISIFPLLKTVVVGTPRRPVQVIPLLIWIFGSDPSRWQWCWCLVVRVSWCRRATTLSCSAHLRLSCVWQSTVKYFITPACDSSDFNAVIKWNLIKFYQQKLN